MLTVEDYARIRRAYRDETSIREIARRCHHSRRKVREALREPEPRGHTPVATIDVAGPGRVLPVSRVEELVVHQPEDVLFQPPESICQQARRVDAREHGDERGTALPVPAREARLNVPRAVQGTETDPGVRQPPFRLGLLVHLQGPLQPTQRPVNTDPEVLMSVCCGLADGLEAPSEHADAASQARRVVRATIRRALPGADAPK